MRLSDIKGDRVFDVIAEIINPIANIKDSEAAQGLFKREKVSKEDDAKKILLERVKVYVPALLKSNKEDLTAILAAIEGCTPEEYLKSLNMAKLVKDAGELLTDEEFMSFFSSTATPSGDATENTEGTEAAV